MLSVRSRRRRVLVAEMEGEVVGFAIAYRHRDTAYVDSIAVDPGFRGAGIGKVLLDTLEKTLVEDGANLIALSVKDGNKRALDFYLRNGYTLKGIILLMKCDVNALPLAEAAGFSLKRVKAGSLRKLKNFKPTTWWSSLTEPVDRLIYKRFVKAEDALLAYKNGRLRGVLEFSVDSEILADYVALSSYTATDALKTLLAGLRRVGLEVGASTVAVPVDASKKFLVEAFLESGFRTLSTEYLAVKDLSE